MDRGQLYTLEGTFAALIVILSVFFALQATTTTLSTGSQGQLETDGNVAQSALNSIDDETLRTAVLYWDDDGFHCAGSSRTYYTGQPDTSSCSPNPPTGFQDDRPTNEFGANLTAALGDDYDYNVVLRYNDSGSIESQQMVFQGQPGAGAVRGRASVPLSNDDQFYAPGGQPSGTRLADDPGRLYAPALDGDVTDGDLYNVVYVEVVVWHR